ncbi:MAG: hypothetical protein V9G10_12690 [Candidatus Nanopelagicales bacterium]
MWQFERGGRAGWPTRCLTLGIPVTGGNVSFYNQTGDDADPPDAGGGRARGDRRRRAPHADRRWGPDGETDLPARCHEAASSAVRRSPRCKAVLDAACRQSSTWRPNARSSQILVAGSRDGMLTAAHDVSDGGVALALAEMAMRAGSRCPDLDPGRGGHVHVAVQRVGNPGDRGGAARLRSCGSRRCAAPAGSRCERIGVVDSGLGDVLQIGDIDLGIGELREVSRGVLPSHF